MDGKRLVSLAIMVSVFIILMVFGEGVSAQPTLRYSENFDDQSIDAPPVGSFTYLKYTGTAGTYNLTETGRGGSGHCFSSDKLGYATLVYTGQNRWTDSGVNNEYYHTWSYVPNEPIGLKYNNAGTYTSMNKGTVGSLGNNEWGWANSKIYVKLDDSSDPDSKASSYLGATYVTDTPGTGEPSEGLTWIMWTISDTWYTDELYVRFYMRYPQYAFTDGNENFKIFYPHWNGLGYICNIFQQTDSQIYAARAANGSYPGGFYPLTPNQADGNWHKYEWWIKFSTAQVKFWYDDTLTFDLDYDEELMGWNGDIYYLTFGAQDSEEAGNVRRQIDDIEVWDGMPPEYPECSEGQIRSCDTGELGICQNGTETCSGGVWGACIRDNDPSTEICGDDIDQDCDGSDLACSPCTEGQITQRCECGETIYESGYCCTGIWDQNACRLYYENFDDGNFDQPNTGTITAYIGNGVEAQEDVGCDGGQHYDICTTGRGGTGYCFAGKPDQEAYLVWFYSDIWYSDEMYVSFYQRFDNYEYTDPNENFKVFYPHWDGANSYVHLSCTADDTVYYSARDRNGNMLTASNWLSFPNQFDGNWHHYEFYIKFSTAEFKAWYDGSLKIDDNFADESWTNNIYYITMGSIDAEEQGIFTRWFDDWEVWDGMPGEQPPCIEDWQCTDWSDCIAGEQTRVCTDQNNCGTEDNKSAEIQSCTLQTTISVDSTYSGYSISVIDDEIINPYGGTSTTWASESSAQPHWITINFTQAREINNVTIYWAFNNASHQQKFMSSQEVWVQYWDGSDYANASIITNTQEENSSSVTFPEIATTSLRLYQPPNMGYPSYPTVIWLTEIDYSSFHPADTNPQDDCIVMNELLAFIDKWKLSSEDVPMPQLMEAISLWKSGFGCP